MRAIRTRTASLEETLRLADDTIPAADRKSLALPDGDPNACRLILLDETGEVERARDGSQRYSAPWLLCGVFSVK
jgi:hypothetical protein